MFEKLSNLGEFELIDYFSKRANSTRKVVKGIGDDTAVLDCGVSDFILFTTDMMSEGVHFTRRMNPLAIGRKILACNISDIAAMGGVPTFAVVSFAAPSDTQVRFAKEIFKGINKLAKKFNVAIVGGDTIKSKKIVINIALMGKVKRKDVVLRSGAKKGDLIFVTGSLGGSLDSNKHLQFTPRIKESQFLVSKLKPSSMIDISDGLIADLGHILNQSNVGAILFEEEIPVSQSSNFNGALYDGEDFELLFTLPKLKAERLLKISPGKFRFSQIGEIVGKGEGLCMLDINGQKFEVEKKGFRHF